MANMVSMSSSLIGGGGGGGRFEEGTCLCLIVDEDADVDD